MPLQDFQLRVVEEKNALDDKLSRLVPFMDGEKFKELPEAEQERMTRQRDIMHAYSNVLTERIEAFSA